MMLRDVQQQSDSLRTQSQTKHEMQEKRSSFSYRDEEDDDDVAWDELDLSTRSRIHEDKTPIRSHYPRGLSASWNLDMSALFSSQEEMDDCVGVDNDDEMKKPAMTHKSPRGMPASCWSLDEEENTSPIVSKYPRGMSASWNFDISTMFESMDLSEIPEETESTLETLASPQAVAPRTISRR